MTDSTQQAHAASTPNAAVEAAAKALRRKFSGYQVERPWDSRDQQRTYRNDAIAALEAAAPFILAGVWDQGAVAGWQQSGEGFNAEYPDESTGGCSVDLTKNPYRRG